MKNMKKKHRCFPQFVLILVYLSSHLTTSAQIRTPLKSFPEVFTYYAPQNMTFPYHSDAVSKGILMFDKVNQWGSDPAMLESVGTWNQDAGARGTAFLIRTIRDDNKICMCMTGHQILNLFNSSIQPTQGNVVLFNSDVYMDYLGEDSSATLSGESVSLNRTVSFKKGFLGTVQVRAVHYDPESGKDIALLLIDRRQLPSGDFAMLGYDFIDAGWEYDTYYSIGHPQGYPQRIHDNYSHFVTAQNYVGIQKETLPGAFSNGNSGSPVLRQVGSSGYSSARGVVSSHWGPNAGVTAGTVYDPYFGVMSHDRNVNFTKIGVIENEIRRDCWKTSDSTTISNTGIYKNTLVVNNAVSLSPYGQNQVVANTAALTGSSGAVFSETVAGNLEVTHLRADVCTIGKVGGFSLPVVYPGTTRSWNIVVTAQEIQVNSEFSYTATADAGLYLSSVVLSGTGNPLKSSSIDSMQSMGAVHSDTLGDLLVFPNPSRDGKFVLHLSSPEETYRIEVLSLEGRSVFSEAGINGAHPFELTLSDRSKGIYLVQVQEEKEHGNLFQSKVIYW